MHWNIKHLNHLTWLRTQNILILAANTVKYKMNKTYQETLQHKRINEVLLTRITNTAYLNFVLCNKSAVPRLFYCP